MHFMKRRLGGFGLGCLASAVSGGGAAGQCVQWLQNTSVFPARGCSAVDVADLHVADLDGPGPLPEELLIGVSDSGGTARVVRWDGTRFLTMPGRFHQSSSPLDWCRIYDMETHQGELYLGGSFMRVDNVFTPREGVAVLRNGKWSMLPNGPGTLFVDDLWDLHSDGERLLAVGQGMRISSTSSVLAAFDAPTNRWTNVPIPLATYYNSCSVTSFGGDYFVGGMLENAGNLAIVRGPLGSFSASARGLNQCVSSSLNVRKFQVWNGSLHALGYMGDPATYPAGSGIRRWTGTEWVDAGISANFPIFELRDIHGLVELNGVTYAYGSSCQFREPRMARFQNGQWEPVPVPLNINRCGGPTAFFDSEVYNGEIVLAMRDAPGLWFFNGETWRPQTTPLAGDGFGLFDLALDGDTVVVTGPGDGTNFMWRSWPAPPQFSTNVARLTDQGWEPVGAGYATSSARRILKWRDTLVQATDQGFRMLENGVWVNPIPAFASWVSAAIIWNDDLIFMQNGIVRRFDGSNVTALSPVDPPRAFNSDAIAFLVHQGQLLMGGNFTSMSRAGEAPIPMQSLVRWNGQDWENVSPVPLTGTITFIGANGNDLFVGGGSNLQLGGVPQTGLLRWIDAQGAWAVSAGHPGGCSVIVSANGALYANSSLSSQGGLWRLDPATNVWSRLAGSPQILNMVADPQGRWLHVISRDNPQYEVGHVGYGRLSLGAPVIERQPVDTTVSRTRDARFSTDVLTLRSSYTLPDSTFSRNAFQWRRDGVNLSDGITPHGSIVSSATGPWLRISNAQLEDQGAYECLVSSICPGTSSPTGTTITQTATLTVTVPICDPVDFNNDGSLFDPTDVDAFLSVFSEGPCIPTLATCNDVDFNNDGSIFDPQDVDAFLSVFSEGPCF